MPTPSRRPSSRSCTSRTSEVRVAPAGVRDARRHARSACAFDRSGKPLRAERPQVQPWITACQQCFDQALDRLGNGYAEIAMLTMVDSELLWKEWAQAGIERLTLEAKEGLALTNGVDFMASAGALAVHDAENLLAHATIAAALGLEAMLGLSAAFASDLQEASGQPGQGCRVHRTVAAADRRAVQASPHRYRRGRTPE